jgi:hypothetical protein
MIDSLAVFLKKEERRRSRYASDSRDAAYAPDLFLQGIVQDLHTAQLTAAQIIQSSTPSTIVSLADCSVRQTKQRIEYAFLRGEHESTALQRFEEETLSVSGLDVISLSHLASSTTPGVSARAHGVGSSTVTSTPVMPAAGAGPGSSGSNSNNSDATGQLFHAISTPSRLLRDFFKQIFKPNTIYIRQAFLEQFLRTVFREAFVLLQQADAMQATPSTPLSADALRKLRRVLLLTEDGDFDIVLAFAEKLRKDTTLSVIGDPRQREQQAINLLQGF